MLTVKDLIDINYVPKESEISLKLYIDFYEQYLCKNIYIFTLKNGSKVKLFFRDTTEIFHVSGIEHIYKGTHMDANRFIQLVKEGKLELSQLKAINSKQYKDYIDRICCFACINTIIRNCQYLWFSKGKIPKTTIKVSYLLFKALDGKNIHLGIDTYKEGRPYFSRTLLITEENNWKKFIEKADEKLQVNKIEIVEKERNITIELIDREKAEKESSFFIESKLKVWERKQLPEYIKCYYEKLASKSETIENISVIILKYKQKIYEEALQLVLLDTEIKDIREIYIETVDDKDEWKKYLNKEIRIKLKQYMNDNEFWKMITYKYCLGEIEQLLDVPKTVKRMILRELRKTLKSSNEEICSKISSYDRYRASNIVKITIEKKVDEYENSIRDTIENYKKTNKMDIVNLFTEYSKEKIKLIILNEIFNKICLFLN